MNHENSIHVELGNDILKSKTLFTENDSLGAQTAMVLFPTNNIIQYSKSPHIRT